MCISRATVSAVSCLVVPAFICIELLISRVLKINDDDDDEYFLFKIAAAACHESEFCRVHLSAKLPQRAEHAIL